MTTPPTPQMEAMAQEIMELKRVLGDCYNKIEEQREEMGRRQSPQPLRSSMFMTLGDKGKPTIFDGKTSATGASR